MGTDEQVCAVDAKLSVQKDMRPWAKKQPGLAEPSFHRWVVRLAEENKMGFKNYSFYEVH